MLAGAARGAEHVVPLFVRDDRITGPGLAAGRTRFLNASLSDLDTSLRELGGRLVLRTVTRSRRSAGSRPRWSPPGCTSRGRVGVRAGPARGVASGADLPVPGARRRAHGGAARRAHPVGQGSLRRCSARTTASGRTPSGASSPRPPRRIVAAGPSGRARCCPPRGTTARRRDGGPPSGSTAWLRSAASSYADHHDLLAVDGTSRLSPYLHLGCVSGAGAGAPRGVGGGVRPPARVARLPPPGPGGPPGRGPPRLPPARRPAGSTTMTRSTRGAPATPASRSSTPACGSCSSEGWMHNRARMIVASFLTKTLYLDWRRGRGALLHASADGDLANNCLNWQWVAGTGTDTRPNRVLQPVAAGGTLRPGRRLRPAAHTRTVQYGRCIGAPAVGTPCQGKGYHCRLWTAKAGPGPGSPRLVERLVGHRQDLRDHQRPVAAWELVARVR